MNKLGIITKGIIKENPVLVLLLGTCPFLATTTSAFNGLGMGVSTTAVLVCSNIVISILKKIIPDKVRIPCYIVVIAGFVTIVQMLLKAYLPELDKSLGLFIPLIVVNCIILGRAEMFASKNKVLDSLLDGVGMGLGFTLALFMMGAIRELLGSGAILGFHIIPEAVAPMTIFMLAPGGFFVYGLLVAAINYFSNGRAIKKKDFSCESCGCCDSCGSGADAEKSNLSAPSKALDNKTPVPSMDIKGKVVKPEDAEKQAVEVKAETAEAKAKKTVEVKADEPKEEKPAEAKAEAADVKAEKNVEVKVDEPEEEKPAEAKAETADVKAEKNVQVKADEPKEEKPAEAKAEAADVKAEKNVQVKADEPKEEKPAEAKAEAAENKAEKTVDIKEGGEE